MNVNVEQALLGLMHTSLAAKMWAIQKAEVNYSGKDMYQSASQGGNNQDGFNDKKSDTKAAGLALVIFIVAANILKDVVDNWLPKYLAMGLSLLIVSLVFYPIRRVKPEYSFMKWALMVTGYASIGTIILGILFIIFRRLGWE